MKNKTEKGRSKKAHVHQQPNERIQSSLVKHLEDNMVKPGGRFGKKWYPNTEHKKNRS